MHGARDRQKAGRKMATMDKPGMAARRPLAAMRRLAGFLGDLVSDRRGVAAIEFAFIAPLLLMLYLVTMEVAQGIDTNKKVSRVGSMVADLVTQQPREITTTVLDPIMRIGEAILQPYNRSRPTIIITGITIDKDAKAEVAWSRKMIDGVFSRDAVKGTPADVDDRLKIPGTFLVRVSSQLDYQPVMTWNAKQKTTLGLLGAFDNIDMGEVYYLRPRMTSEILCTNC